MGAISPASWKSDGSPVTIVRAAALAAALLASAACTSVHGVRARPEPAPKPTLRAATARPAASMLALSTASAADAGYRIGAGDTLSVMIHGHDDLTVKEVAVLPDGRVSLPLVEAVKAAGRTRLDLQEEIERRMTPYVTEPRVSVGVVRVGSQRFSVLGRVDAPGVYPLEPDMRVLDAIARAGGFYSRAQFRTSTVEIVDLHNTLLIRRGETAGVDFHALISKNDLTQNVLIEPGDTIYVPSSLAREVHVLGEVKVPQSVGFTESITLLQALARAEGPLFTGKLSHLQLVRGEGKSRKSYLIDLQEILDGREPDVPLEPGDVVHVPTSGLARWSRNVIQLLPFIQPITSGAGMMSPK